MKMNSFKLCFMVLILFGISYQSIAQPLRAQTYEQMLEIAQESADNGDFYNAKEWFEKAYDENRDKRLVPAIAKLHYMLRDFDKAESWYKRLWSSRRSESSFVDERFMYALVLKENGKYEESIANFQQLMAETEDEDLKKQAKFHLDGIKALNSMEANVDVGFRFIGNDVNSGSGESSPRMYRDGNLYFSSYQRNNAIEIAEEDDDYHSKIHYVSKDDEGNYEDPTVLGEQINRKGFHSSNITFSKDGRVMYFTRSQLTGSVVSYSKIYQSFRKDDEWSPAAEVAGINGDYVAQHPAAGELYGKDVVFFVSDMEGGYGGKDIYYSTANSDGSFTSPTNLGEGINTAGDEITPFYADGVLYFSTDGVPTIGGLDIFKTSWNGSNWSDPENMGFSFNTSYDDLYYSQNSDAMSGFVVSNRPDDGKKRLKSKTCCDDIYEWQVKEVVIDLLAKVFDPEKMELNGATLTLKNLTQVITPEVKTFPESNSFQFLLDGDNSYKLVIEKSGYYPDSIEFNTAGIIDDFTVKRSIELKPMPVEPEEPVVEYETVTINQPIRLNNIYYDFDDDKILLDAEKDLNVLFGLLNQYPDMVIELSSHTDAQGISRYNEDLSQRRAESARNWLLQKGIAPERIKPVGYGEQQILNRCVDGVRCDDDEHRINRRTEFKIIAGPKTIEIKKEQIKSGNSQGSIDLNKPKSTIKGMPKVSFKQSYVDLGEVKRGETRMINYEFTNTGNADLKIEVVTACKCTEITWPREDLAPGKSGKIKVVFDSSTFEAGEYTKIVDMIANTEPLINEAKFRAVITE